MLTALILVGAFLAFAFRTYLTEWIKKRFGRALQAEIEEHKHKLAREMEAYKSSMVRELEQLRANIDIKRTVALRIAQARIEALQDLAPDFAAFINQALTMPCVPKAQRMSNYDQYNQSLKAVNASARKASLHLSRELDTRIADILSRGVALVLKTYDKPPLDDNNPMIASLLEDSAAVSNALHDALHADVQALR